MSQPAPSLENGFALPPGFPLDRTHLQPLLTQIAGVITTLQGVATTWEALVEAGTTQALAMVAENIAPQIQAAQALIDELQQNAEEANDGVVAAFQQTITALQAKITEAEQALAVLLSGEFPADSVTETSARAFVSPEQKASIPAGKASAEEATAGTDNTKFMTPARVADAVAALAAAKLQRSAKTAGYTVASSDKNKFIDCSGTFTLAFAAAATLADGFACYIGNSGTGDVTLDPNASETIDGLTSFVMYPGECRLVICTGEDLHSIVLTSFFKTFTASGPFVKPPGYSSFAGLAWGGGGSGGKGGQYGSATGGGGGACVPFDVPAASVASSEDVVIASGGAPQLSDFASGNPGGTTSLGALVTAHGGGAGYGTNSFVNCSGGSGAGGLGAGVNGGSSGASGGSPSAASSSNDSGFGGASAATNSNGGSAAYGGAAGGGAGTTTALNGGSALFGGAGGGAENYGASSQGLGGTSRFGGSGGGGAKTTPGQNGAVPGGGGGATGTGTNSGAGARGELRIRGMI